MKLREAAVVWIVIAVALVMGAVSYSSATCDGAPPDRLVPPIQVAGWGSCPNGQCPVPRPGQRSLVPPRQHRQYQSPAPDQYRQPATSTTNPAVCRIRNQTSARTAYLGSGTLIDQGNGCGLVVTCHHIFRDDGVSVICEFPDGKRYQGRRVSDKFNNDLAAILIRDPGITPVEVAVKGPRIGEQASSAGYGGDARYLVNYGRVEAAKNDHFEIRGAARPGDSGGPMFNAKGHLIGVLFGTSTDGEIRRRGYSTVYGTSSVTADTFLLRAGRYLLPWNARNNNPNFGPPGSVPRPSLQPPTQQPGQSPSARPAVDPSPLESRVAELERRTDRIRDMAEIFAAKYEKDLPGISNDLDAALAATERAVAEVDGAVVKLDEALDEDNPKGLLAKAKTRIGQVTGIAKILGWTGVSLGSGATILAAIALVVVLVRRGGRAADAGDPTLLQRATKRTPWEWDDRLADFEAEVLARAHRRLHPQTPPPIPPQQPAA